MWRVKKDVGMRLLEMMRDGYYGYVLIKKYVKGR